MKKTQKKTKYFSQTWSVKVRPSIVREFTYNNKFFDENLAGLHEIQARMILEKAIQKNLSKKQDSF